MPASVPAPRARVLSVPDPSSRPAPRRARRSGHATGRRSAWWSVALLVSTLLLLLSAAPAVAHSGLEDSDPPDGAVLDRELDGIELTFTAPVRLLDDSVVAVGPDGRRVAADERRDDDGLAVAATFDVPLTDGEWDVQWRVLATDSHPRTGTVHVTVPTVVGAGGSAADDAAGAQATPGGDAPASGAATSSSPASSSGEVEDPAASPGAGLEGAAAIARVLFYIGLLVAAGLALFKAGPHSGMPGRARRLAGVALLGAVIGLLAGVAEVALHVASVSGRGLAGTVDVGTWRAVLGTGLGPALALRVVGLGLLAFGARRRIRAGLPSGADWRKLLGALLAVASFQFVGHTASRAPELLVRSADLVHAVAAAVWVGGLVGLAVTARTAAPERRAVTVARFSEWATAAVAGVTLAGVALAWVNLPSMAAAWQTGYGRLLLAKLVLVGLLLALGAHNHVNVVPGVVRGEHGAAAVLRRVVRWELVVIGAVVVLTALLVNTTPV